MGLIIDAPTNLGLRPPTPGCVPGADKAPQALRAAGLHAALREQGWIESPPVLAGRYRPEISPGQVRNQAAIVEHAHRLGFRITQALGRGEKPLVLGGDCSTLLGVGLELAERGRYGLIHLDGHTDFRHPGNDSQSANLAGGRPRLRCWPALPRAVTYRRTGPVFRAERRGPRWMPRWRRAPG